MELLKERSKRHNHLRKSLPEGCEEVVEHRVKVLVKRLRSSFRPPSANGTGTPDSQCWEDPLGPTRTRRGSRWERAEVVFILPK